MVAAVPGDVMEFGVWWGQSLTVLESLRAIHEPYSRRKMIGFDTFEGYPEPGEKDVRSETIKKGGYHTSPGYENHLKALLEYHSAENGGPEHELIKGNVTETLPAYLGRNQHTLVSLAIFDMALYEPTKTCIQEILPRLVKGSVLAFDELADPAYPGETLAVLESLNLRDHEVIRSRYLPDRTNVIIR